jgi:hypothetical protein
MENKMPIDLKEKIKHDIHQRLNPAWSSVFLKLALIQFVAGFLVLLVCPQFNLGFFPHSSLGHLFMSWGEFACTLACGALFIGTGLMISLLVLTTDELRILRLREFSTFGIVSLLSLGAFMILGVEFQLVLFVAWICGAMISAVGGLELYWGIKRSHLV